MEGSKRNAKHTNKAMAKLCLTKGTVEGTGFADIAGSRIVNLLYFVEVLMQNSTSALKAAKTLAESSL